MKRVAAYCRVSTEQDDQLSSLESQKLYFEQYISGNADWEFCGLYVDEGISGTSVEKRAGFKRMIADAENKKFDLLLTKEISRFARNTLDSIFYTRKLKGLGVGVHFMNDNINTLDADAELRLTIMSSIAQEESRKTSERIRWGQKRLMERGVAFGAKVLGYNLKDGKLTINEDEAKTVRLIFDLYLNSGIGAHTIRKELENRGIPSPSGNTRWTNKTIFQILKNEKYAGVLKQKKSITVDYLSHKRKVNKGEENFIIVENSHEPIISREIYDKAQKEITRRKSAVFEKSRYSNRHVWSGKIKCAYCGSTYKRITNNLKTYPIVVWQCKEALQYGKEKINASGQKVGCNCKPIHEEVLRDNFLAVLNGVIENKDQAIRDLKEAVQRAIDSSPDKSSEIKAVGADMDKIIARKSKILDLYADEGITRDEFNQANSQYSKQLEALSKQLTALKLDNKIAEDLTQKLNNIETTIEAIVKLKEFSDSVCGEVLNKVIVEGREKISFYLTAGENTEPTFFKIPLSAQQY